MRRTTRDIERSNGLIYAGTTRACGMDIEVYTSTGRLPLWSGADDPAPIEANLNGESSKPAATVLVYVLTEKGIDTVNKYDRSITDPRYTNLMVVLEAIHGGCRRQIELGKKLNLPQQKIWYRAKKLIEQGLIEQVEV